jgi:hypothetical protein
MEYGVSLTICDTGVYGGGVLLAGLQYVLLGRESAMRNMFDSLYSRKASCVKLPGIVVL